LTSNQSIGFEQQELSSIGQRTFVGIEFGMDRILYHRDWQFVDIEVVGIEVVDIEVVGIVLVDCTHH